MPQSSLLGLHPNIQVHFKTWLKTSADAGLIQLVCQQLTTGPCQSFRRPTAPTDSVITDMPAMTSFSKAAFDGGIEHDAVQSLYQVASIPAV